MCYSALAEQDLKKYQMRKGTAVDLPAFKKLFQRRFDGENLYIPKGLEANFLGDSKETEDIKNLILGFKKNKISEEQQNLFAFKRRFDEAEKKLAEKVTKSAQKEKEVSERQMDRTKQRLQNLESTHLTEGDYRIFPMGWAPLLLMKGGQLEIVPTRYHLRPQGQPESFDRKYDGNYNARRENLEKVVWWKNLFGKNHGIFIFNRFFENVPQHKFEHRDLRKDEPEQNLVLEFTPSDHKPMYIAALYDAWPDNNNPQFYSAAAITMDPPPEVAATGHQRCIVPIPEALVDQWLKPGQPLSHYYGILDQRVMPYFEHKIAVA
jgi:putative SOS response-associated peptidase YedK